MSLPDQPSELLKLALNDLIQVENDPRYDINMGEWHYPRETACSVCLAGAVMAGTLDADPGEELSPEDFEQSNDAWKLYALDSARWGDWDEFLKELGLDLHAPDELFEELPTVCRYDVDPEQFKADIRQAIDVLNRYSY